MNLPLDQPWFKVSAAGWSRLAAARWLWVPGLAFALTRLGIVLIAYISVPLIADSSVTPYHLRPDNILLDVFGSRWDSGFYINIATKGYSYQEGSLSSVAFFPLLPLLIQAVTPLVGDAVTAGLLITNAALLGAVILLYRLVCEEWGAGTADRAVWYILIFPTSFFASAIYSESLFFLAAVGALYLARRGHWEGAAMLGYAAALSRLIGLLVAPMLILEWWQQRRRPGVENRPSLAMLLAPALVPLGTLAYMLYLDRRFGDPLAFAHAAAAWGREPRLPLTVIGELLQRPAGGWSSALATGRLPLDGWIDLAFVLVFLGLGLSLLIQRRWSEGVFVFLGVLIPFGSGLLLSQRRYVWVLFPAFVLLARWGERPWVDRAITVASILGLGIFMAMFANWYWVA